MQDNFMLANTSNPTQQQTSNSSAIQQQEDTQFQQPNPLQAQMDSVFGGRFAVEQEPNNYDTPQRSISRDAYLQTTQMPAPPQSPLTAPQLQMSQQHLPQATRPSLLAPHSQPPQNPLTAPDSGELRQQVYKPTPKPVSQPTTHPIYPSQLQPQLTPYLQPPQNPLETPQSQLPVQQVSQPAHQSAHSSQLDVSQAEPSVTLEAEKQYSPSSNDHLNRSLASLIELQNNTSKTLLVDEIIRNSFVPTESIPLVKEYLNNSVPNSSTELFQEKDIANVLNKTLYSLRGKAPHLFEQQHHTSTTPYISNGATNALDSRLVNEISRTHQDGEFDMSSYRNVFNQSLTLPN
jgi:hypothetical protein